MKIGLILPSLFLSFLVVYAGITLDVTSMFQNGLKNPLPIWNWEEADAHPAIYKDPIQSRPNMKPVQMNGAKLVPLASFDITSRLVAVTKYNDTLARWSPLDFSVTWGPIAKADISADLGVTQSQRYFHYNPGGSGISYQTISRHSANIHIIPANDEIAKKTGHIESRPHRSTER